MPSAKSANVINNDEGDCDTEKPDLITCWLEGHLNTITFCSLLNIDSDYEEPALGGKE